MKTKHVLTLALFWAVALALGGCVNQHPAAENAKNLEASPVGESRIVATSYAAAEVCNILQLDLVGVPKTASKLPERYLGLPEVGSAMGPDLETLAALKPTDVIGPDTLEGQLGEKYAAAAIPGTFLNLRSVQGLYDSLQKLGEKYEKSDLANAATEEYQSTMKRLEEARGNQEGPTVLILMGFPGSYCEATASSYIGNLVELAGGKNVVAGEEDFVSYNTEKLMQLNPDYILWTSHALPDLVGDMFQKEFATNDVWKHFSAVQQGRVIELDSGLFHMSANFKWPQALEFLNDLFYGAKE